MKSIIIEDDPSMVIEYEMLLDKKGVQLLGSFNNTKEAFIAIQSEKPDFIILDIHLENSESGIELASKIKKLYIPILFVTGFPERVFFKKAQELKAETFLIKPFNSMSLEFEVDKIISKIKNQNQHKKFIFIKDKNNFVKVPFEDILYIDIEGNYSTIYTLSKRFVLKKSLAKISKEIDPDLFIQIHRSAIVNKQYIKNINFNSSQLILQNAKSLKIGNNFIKKLRSYLKGSDKIVQ